MTRQEANCKILKILVNEVEKYPDLRFGQILRNLMVVEEEHGYQSYDYGWSYDSSWFWKDGFNEESEQTLKRMTGE